MKTTTYLYKNNTWTPELNLNSKSNENQWVLLFGERKLLEDNEILIDINSKFPNSTVIGCSTSGEIYEENFHENSISLVVVDFEKTKIKPILINIEDFNSNESVGQEIATNLKSEDLKSIFLLSDGLNINGSALVKGIKDNIQSKISITGGLAGDGADFQKTCVVYKNKSYTNHIVALGLYGDKLKVGTASEGGWMIFGPQRKVTRAEGNILFELDGQPALDIYKKYLGEKSKDLPASALLYPLRIETPDGRPPIVRTILSVDEETKSMTFAGDMPEGSIANFMHSNFNKLIEGANSAYKEAMVGINAEDTLSIAISCVGRKLLLGSRTEEEAENVIDFPNKTSQVGFYSYGEIGHRDDEALLHNQTYTLTVITEAA